VNKILAIDQSTSGTKALIFNEKGKLLDKTFIPHQQIYPQPGWVEHDAEEIYLNTIQAVREVLSRNHQHLGQLLCVSITNQRETVVVFDRLTGKPLHNALVWQCRRGTQICEKLIQAGFENLIHKKTGLKIDTYFSAPKLAWLINTYPEIYERLAKGSALIGNIDTYLIYRLTKGKTFATDYTNASRTLLFNIRNLEWDSELCSVFGVPIQSLPEIRESGAKYGETTFEGLLEKPLPICGVIGDSQAALFGQRCFAPGEAKITFGSGTSILLNIGEQVKYSPNGIVTTIGWVYNKQPVYAYEGIINYTGATVAWLKDQLQLISSPEETEILALASNDNGGVYFVPAFVGLGAPYWRPNARAAIVGLTPSSSKKHVVRAALESIAFLVNDVLRVMAQDARVSLKHVYADGGAAKNRFLMQFVSDITNLKVFASLNPDLSGLGAALFGALGMGIFASIDSLYQIPTSYTTYNPSMEVSLVDALIKGWKRALYQVLAVEEK